MGKSVKKRSEIEEQYKWQLEDMIPSSEALSELMEKLEAGVSRYEEFRGTLGRSPKALREFFLFDEGMDEEISRLYAYAMQKSDEDTGDNDAQALVSKIQMLSLKAMSAASFVEPEILAIPDETMNTFLASQELVHYKKRLERLLTKKEHMLTEAEERILAQSLEATQAPSTIYGLFNNADLKFPAIRDEDGDQVEVTHGRYGSLLESRDRAVREAAFHACYSSYRQFANTVAAVFEGNLKQARFYARVRRYSSTRDYYLSENEIPEAVYDNLLAAVEERLPLLHRYVAIKKKCLGVEKLHMYDLYAPMVPDAEIRCTYEEAQGLILEALKPLGEEYVALLKQGFEGRWIDVYENEGKRSGAYSNCVYGVHPYVLMSYDGTLSSALTLAHEMGHSLHSWYSNEAQSFTYANYRIFVAEVASTCNEVLFLRHMIEKAEHVDEKKYLISQLLERFRTTMFRQTMFAEFEWEAHKLAWQGTPLTKDVLCSLYHKLNEKYHGSGMAVDSDIDYEWERIPHFYRPFYVYQYATGFAAATAIAGRILAGDQETLDGYFRFLKGGCSMTPVELLSLCGLDMEKPQVVNEALDVFEKLMDEFERL